MILVGKLNLHFITVNGHGAADKVRHASALIAYFSRTDDNRADLTLAVKRTALVADHC